MKNQLTTPDYLVSLLYFIAVSAYGYFIYHKKRQNRRIQTAFSLLKAH
jgi:SSS family solute:Na+ symporter